MYFIKDAATNPKVTPVSNIDPLPVQSVGVQTAKTEDLAGTQDDLYSITGIVKILALIGEVRNTVGAGVTDYIMRIKTTGTVIVNVTNLAGKTADTLLQLAGGEALIEGASGAKLVTSGTDAQQVRYIGTTGGTCVIEGAHTAGDSGDAITWYIEWVPVSPGATLVAA